MALPLLASLGPLLAKGASGLGSALATQTGQAALGAGAQAATPYAFQGLQRGYNWLTGNKPQINERESVLQSIMDQLNDRSQFDFTPIREDATRHFQEEILPMIREQYAGVRSGVPQLLQERAGQDLATRLAALQQQFNVQNQQQNLQRLGQQEQLIRGNQQYGLQRSGARQAARQIGPQQRSQQLRELLSAYGQTQEPTYLRYNERQPGFPETAARNILPAAGRLGAAALGV